MALFHGIVVLLAYVVYIVFEPFLVALAWAVILAVVSHPLYLRLLLRRGRTGGAAAATAAVTPSSSYVLSRSLSFTEPLLSRNPPNCAYGPTAPPGKLGTKGGGKTPTAVLE